MSDRNFQLAGLHCACIPDDLHARVLLSRVGTGVYGKPPHRHQKWGGDPLLWSQAQPSINRLSQYAVCGCPSRRTPTPASLTDGPVPVYKTTNNSSGGVAGLLEINARYRLLVKIHTKYFLRPTGAEAKAVITSSQLRRSRDMTLH